MVHINNLPEDIRLIENSVTNPTNSLMLGELGASVARSEIIFLIKELSNSEKSEIDTFSIDKIKERSSV